MCKSINEENNLKKIVLKDFNDAYLQKNNINMKIANLEKMEDLKFESMNFSQYTSLFDLFISQTGNLKSLTLKNARMGDHSLNKLMESLRKFYNSLEFLDLSNNSFSIIDFSIFLLDEKGTKKFDQLKYLNFSNNNIYKLRYIMFPNIMLVLSITIHFYTKTISYHSRNILCIYLGSTNNSHIIFIVHKFNTLCMSIYRRNSTNNQSE